MKKRIQEYILVMMGTTMCAAAFGMFILPKGFLAGGVTGSARLICSVIDIPVSILVLMINITLLLMGLIVMGRQFVSKSVFSSLYFPLALEVTQHIPFPLNALPVPAVAVMAGTVLGAGAALVIRSKGSSGGYAIIAVILNDKFGMSIPIIVNGIDLVLILTQIPGAAMFNIIGGLLTIVVSTSSMHITLNGIHIPVKKQLSTGRLKMV